MSLVKGNLDYLTTWFLVRCLGTLHVEHLDTNIFTKEPNVLSVTVYLLVPPSGHVPTSSRTFIIVRHLLPVSPHFAFSPDHLTNITPVLTSFVSPAGTWPTLLAPSPVSTLLHQPCRYLASPYPLTLCQSIHAALLGSCVFSVSCLPANCSACRLLCNNSLSTHAWVFL